MKLYMNRKHFNDISLVKTLKISKFWLILIGLHKIQIFFEPKKLLQFIFDQMESYD